MPLMKIRGMKVITVINGALRAAERREANFNLSK